MNENMFFIEGTNCLQLFTLQLRHHSYITHDHDGCMSQCKPSCVKPVLAKGSYEVFKRHKLAFPDNDDAKFYTLDF